VNNRAGGTARELLSATNAPNGAPFEGDRRILCRAAGRAQTIRCRASEQPLGSRDEDVAAERFDPLGLDAEAAHAIDAKRI
jgi:hypothetical protein